MNEIDKYMTIGEAADRWNMPIETIKNKLKPSIKGTKEIVDKMIAAGMIKYSKHPESKQGVWIISVEAMEHWFDSKKIKKE